MFDHVQKQMAVLLIHLPWGIALTLTVYTHATREMQTKKKRREKKRKENGRFLQNGHKS